MGVIYKATCLINKKSYIGQTKNSLKIRKSQHLRARDNYAFHNALQKYGINNFIWEVLEECDNDLLNEREVYWIDYYDTYNSGYNCTLA